jgi:hypothetical protein
MWDAMNVEVSVHSDKFVHSNIKIYYLRPFGLTLLTPPEAPANSPQDLVFGIDIDPEDEDNVLGHN